MKYSFYLLLFLAIPFLASGQANYKPGIVVTSQSDTLRGFINFKEWEENPVEISFKTDISEKSTQEFTTKNCRYFSITGLENYLRYEGEVSADRIDLDNLGTRISTKTRYVSAFFKVLQQGPNVSLYSFTDLLKTRYFLQEGKTGPLEELAFKKYMDANNNIASVKLYAKKLALMATKYKPEEDDLLRQIDNSTYNAPNLLRITSLINGLTYNEIDLNEKRNHRVNIFSGLGIDRSITQAYSDGELLNQYAKGSILPKAFVGLDIFLNPKVKRLLLRGELGLTLANHEVELPNSLTARTLLNFKQVNLYLSPSILYNLYNKENFKWYVGGGIAANYSNYINLEYSEMKTKSDGVEVIDKSREGDLYKVWISLPAKTGVIINRKLDIGIQYTMRADIAAYSLFKISSVGFQVGYHFNQN